MQALEMIFLPPFISLLNADWNFDPRIDLHKACELSEGDYRPE